MRFCCSVILIILAGAAGFSDPAARHILFNPKSAEEFGAMKGWGGISQTKVIREWALSRKMQLIEDAPPLIDSTAFFTGQYDSVITLEGLDKTAIYTVYIDFVRYSNRSAGQLDTSLNIIVNASGGIVKPNFSLAIKPSDLRDNLYKFEIPFRITSGGNAVITFREGSRVKGLWGFWDIIVTPDKVLPESIEPDLPEMKIKEKIF